MSDLDYSADGVERRAIRAAAVMAVVGCDLCDEHGYRGTVVCDHVDRTAITARGLAKVSAVLRKKTK